MATPGCNVTGVTPVGTIPFLGCCRALACRSWVQVDWFAGFDPFHIGAEADAQARMAAFEASLDMLAQFPFTSNPPPPAQNRRGGLFGNKSFSLDIPPTDLGFIAGFFAASGPCGAAQRNLYISATEARDVPKRRFIYARKIRVNVTASYCTVQRSYDSTAANNVGTPLPPIPGTIIRDSFISAGDLWTDIAMPEGIRVIKWFDEFCDKVPDGVPD